MKGSGARCGVSGCAPASRSAPVLWRSRKRRRAAALRDAGALVFSLFTLPLLAETNSLWSDEKLALSPPHAEIPSSFLEQYGLGIGLAGIAVIALVTIAIWRWRSRTPEALPIEVQARAELEALRGQAEDGRTVSRISRTLRRYVALAFELSPEEMTTSEFCRAADASEKIGADLSAKLGTFLRHCDEFKFAPSPLPPLNAAAGALALIELGEARRTQLRTAVAA
jgi:uncharacterized protein DUF4381